MILFGLICGGFGLAAWFGYLFGVRVEQGRRAVIEELNRVGPDGIPRQQRGSVRLRKIRIRR